MNEERIKWVDFTKKEVDALFLLAGIETKGEHIELPNQYTKSREDSWWLVTTRWGVVLIGWRKRVIEIDWSRTDIRVKVTDKINITSEDTHVHAWSYPQAIEWLSSWRDFAKHHDWLRSDAGKQWLAEKETERV